MHKETSLRIKQKWKFSTRSKWHFKSLKIKTGFKKVWGTII